MFNKILVALDDSEASQLIFEQAVELAKANQAELMLLHVMTPFDDSYPEYEFEWRELTSCESVWCKSHTCHSQRRELQWC
jgi:nucleotide-binding universal stress UspA family protein